MMKNLVYRLSGILVTVLVYAAPIMVKPACQFFHYQSNVPASLRK